jgi:hypothetical protein
MFAVMLKVMSASCVHSEFEVMMKVMPAVCTDMFVATVF